MGGKGTEMGMNMPTLLPVLSLGSRGSSCVPASCARWGRFWLRLETLPSPNVCVCV